MTRLSLCNQSSFCADNVMVTIVPSFTSNSKFNLLSTTSGKNVKVGPFIAGMPINVPLWIAKTLKRRNFAEIESPEWLSVDVLTSILKEERESTVLQDLVAVRSDKLRMHFHELSRSDLVHPPPGYDDVDDDGNYIGDNSVEKQGGGQAELPIISVTGICSYELNKVGPFLQRAFSDYGFLTRRSSSATTTSATSSATKSSSNDGVTTATATTAKKSKGLGGRLRRVSGAGAGAGADGPNIDKENSVNEDDTYDQDDVNDDDGSAVDNTSRRVSIGRSRLRQFRS
jgi:GINS complex subunit 2